MTNPTPPENPSEETPKAPPPREIERVTVYQVPAPTWEEMGEGGEAIIYRSSPRTVAKVFRHWEDPRFADFPDEQEAAKGRFVEMQDKLPGMPELPEEVVAPQRLLQTAKGSILGYEMQLLDSSIVPIDSLWNTATVDEKLVALGSLHALVKKLHRSKVTIGDFVPRDIMWDPKAKKIYLLDSDSLQFGDYNCKSFSLGFTDPKVLKFIRDEKTGLQMATLKRPYYMQSDWFAFLAICNLVMLGTDPFGGFHRKHITKEERVRNGVSIYNPEVTYPKTARPLTEVPRPLLEALFLAIHGGERFVPRKSLFEVAQG